MQNGSLLLLAGVIKQAIEDGLSINHWEKKYRETKDKNKKTIIYRKLSQAYDGKDFIMSHRLNDFITAFNLPLNAGYIQNKYMAFEKTRRKKF